jgi:hypothetical protein
MNMEFFSDAHKARLKETGHVRLDPLVLNPWDKAAFAKVLVGIAEQLGTPHGRRDGALIDTLRPVSSMDARPRSLSAVYGYETQPWHIDRAHWPTPARYLVLGCIAATSASAATELLDWKSLSWDPDVQAAAHVEPFRIRNGRHSFYATMLNRELPLLRHDPGCMEPLSEAGLSLQARIDGRSLAPSARIRWVTGMIVIVDNWRLLHRRMDARADRTRALLRITVLASRCFQTPP